MGGLLLPTLGTAPSLDTAQPQSTAPTFCKDVAPILYKHCVSCHRPGEVGPFSLIEYKEAAKRAEFLAEIVHSQKMPPWKPEAGYGAFRDELRMSEGEKATIAAWAKNGAPEGNKKDLPKPPVFETGWALGKPDLVIEMPKPFKVAAGGQDIYQCFVIPLPLDQDQSIIAVDFLPGNRRVVHHAILFLDSNGQARRKADPETMSYRSFGGPGILPTGSMGAWAPGARPVKLPEGTGRFLKKGSDLVLQVHYHPSGREETDQSKVGIYFAKTPTKHYVGAVALRSRSIAIPPGKADYTITTQSVPLPVPVEALGIFPHMHYLGKEMKVDAVLPDGKEVPLLWIKDWDFNWQGAYAYKDPVRLPKGTVLKLKAVYDNSESNPRNPSSPPKRVKWGEQTTDEMCLCGVQVITETADEMRKIQKMPGGLVGLILGGGGQPEEKENQAKPSDRTRTVMEALLNEFDEDQDGKISPSELEKIPEENRDRAAIFFRIMGKLKK